MKTFSYEIADDGVQLRLSEKKRSLLSSQNIPLKVSDWSSSGDPELLRGLAAIGSHLQELDDHNAQEILLTHDNVARLSDAQANALGLPISIPYQLRVWGTGSYVDNSYDLNSEFLDAGTEVYIDQRIGSFAVIGRIRYRIPDPLYSIIEEVQNFPSDRDGKIEAQAQLSELLGQDKLGTAKLNPDEQVASIRIRHVAAFSAAVSGSFEEPNLSPILFARHTADFASERGDLLDETQQILDAMQATSFVDEFSKNKHAKSTYVLGSGEYVFIDPSVRPAFQAFHDISIADSTTRKAFIKSPNAVLASYISQDVEEPELLVSLAFVVTLQFSDRVRGINEWKVPDLPWLATESNEWGTNVLVFEQPGNSAPVVLPREDLKAAVDALDGAIKSGNTVVNVSGVDIPVSSQLLAAMQQKLPVGDLLPPPPPQPLPPQKRYVVDTIDGFEVVNYRRALNPADDQMKFVPPRALVPATTLMTHQEVGLQWLVGAYNAGLPGVLIADDMGLGKTLQALVFLALYQEQVPKFKRKPCLVVAPTGLLNNWLREINEHLGEAGLGEITQAYGSQLKSLKAGRGRDTDFGVPILNNSRLQSSNIVLTTYETLRDYQISFAQVPFGVVVFDEIQKTKNPRSLLSRAAAAINGTFQIGLSGTPVENSLADLWTILDLLAPGLLKLSLHEFMTEYSAAKDDPLDPNKLKRLQMELLEPEKGLIPPILRRLKSEVFKDGSMPAKIINPAIETCGIMPPEQAAAYQDQLEKAHKGEIKTIQALQAFKRISLSPRPYDRWLEESGEFISASARLGEFFRILDQIKSRDEKALIFLESLEVQPILAQFFKERYGLPKLPLVINGSVSGFARQNSVNEFQSEASGFNVMLISPKAGGVGLTLTAANNVVHLERWWNPAVEDQCNDRAYRIGQTKDVNIYTPVARHPVSEIPSFDLVLDGILSRKRKLADSLFVPSDLTPEDFAKMFTGPSNPEPTNVNFPISLLESYALETGEEFENYVVKALFNSGYTVRITKRSGDLGCDLIAKSGSEVILCQVKQVRSDKVLAQGVEDIIKADLHYTSQNSTRLILITNALSVTSGQMKLAKDNNVLIFYGNDMEHYGEALREKLRSLVN
jgi:hypothetical protein